MTPERRQQIRNGVAAARTGWRNTWREIGWAFGLLGYDGNPSLAKVFCGVLVAILAHREFVREQPMTAAYVMFAAALGIIAISAAYGPQILREALQRFSFGFGSNANQSDQSVRVDVRTLPNAYTDDERG